LNTLRQVIGTCINGDELFNASIVDNITMGRDGIAMTDVLEILDKLCLTDFIRSLPEGLNTKIYNEGQLFPKSSIQKLLLARALVHRPKLLLLEDCFDNLIEKEKKEIIDYLFSSQVASTIICVTNDSYFLSKTDQVYLMSSGTLHHA
ncbi:MAG: hypothetical protein ACKOX3_06885, partial [Bacteroidota bacterium]